MRLHLRNRPGVGAVLATIRSTAELRRLPAPARRFYRAAMWKAIRLRDGYSLRVSLPPAELAGLLRLASGRVQIVELGTANGWTALALAAGSPETRVVTLDPRVRPARRSYVELAGQEVGSRVTFLERGGEDPPEEIDVDLLYIDTTHQPELVRACFDRWMPRVVAGGLVVFDDYVHPYFTGPAQAVRELELQGTALGRMFVWEKPAA